MPPQIQEIATIDSFPLTASQPILVDCLDTEPKSTLCTTCLRTVTPFTVSLPYRKEFLPAPQPTTQARHSCPYNQNAVTMSSNSKVKTWTPIMCWWHPLLQIFYSLELSSDTRELKEGHTCERVILSVNDIYNSKTHRFASGKSSYNSTSQSTTQPYNNTGNSTPSAHAYTTLANLNIQHRDSNLN